MHEMLAIDTERVIASLKHLARFGAQGQGVNRPVLSDADVESRRWLAGEMESAGLTVVVDAVGNVIGKSKAPRALLLGSHTDSVPTGGWLDGALGVIYAIETARAFNLQFPDAPIGCDVVAFSDEEGRYLSCLGSKWFCGELSLPDLARLSYAGIDFAGAAQLAGYDSEVGAQFDARRCIGYFEAHIEQGPRLDNAELDLGIVTGIAGMRRHRIVFKGQADHAGTTPMSVRKDAGMAAFEFAVQLRDSFVELGAPEAVWNFGAVEFRPGVANVVPKEALLTLETRDLRLEVLDEMQKRVADLIESNDGRAGVSITLERVGDLPSAIMDARLLQHVASSAAQLTDKTMHLHSGAIHDAMVLARHVPSAMLFVPSIGGRSHVYLENTADKHLRMGAEVFAGAALSMISGG
ncbi:M20 family metallo-hydrolase [Herbaspirillum lusitanum]|uniref:M20 family metallo-hydrolase n=1 Tax=Herbaspirillum lusitanum TaxID=213312 RepID=A0ABW9AE48_9BURK